MLSSPLMNNTALITNNIINNNIYLSVDLGFINGLTGFIRIIILLIFMQYAYTVSYYIINILQVSPLSTNSHSANDIVLATRIHDPFKRQLPPPTTSIITTTSTITITDYTGNANLICDRHSIRVVDICTPVAILFVVFVVSRNVVGNIVILILRENVI